MPEAGGITGDASPLPGIARRTPDTTVTSRAVSPFVGLAVALTALAALALLAVVLGGGGAEAPRAAVSVTGPATPPPTALPTATANAGADQVILRSLAGGCIPVPGAAACDALRSGLWAGDLETWRQWAALQGSPPPSPAEAQVATIALRLGAGDPAAQIDFARATGRPLVLITRVRLRGRGDERRVMAVELANLGAAPASLAGVTLPGGPPLPAGATLAAGARCELGAAATVPCPGMDAGAQSVPLLPPGNVLQLLGADGRLLDEVTIL